VLSTGASIHNLVCLCVCACARACVCACVRECVLRACTHRDTHERMRAHKVHTHRYWFNYMCAYTTE
jgi:hypothetical protein